MPSPVLCHDRVPPGSIAANYNVDISIPLCGIPRVWSVAVSTKSENAKLIVKVPLSPRKAQSGSYLFGNPTRADEWIYYPLTIN
jgi:hypothetical protein